MVDILQVTCFGKRILRDISLKIQTPSMGCFRPVKSGKMVLAHILTFCIFRLRTGPQQLILPWARYGQARSPMGPG